MGIKTEKIIMIKKSIFLVVISLLISLPGCIPYNSYYLDNLIEQSLLPSPSISISNPKKEMELEVSTGLNYNTKTQTSFKDSSQNVDPSEMEDNIRINLDNISCNFALNFNTGKVINVSSKYQGGKIDDDLYHNISFGVGGRFHYKYIGGLISGILMCSNYDFDVIVKHYWNYGTTSGSQAEVFLDTYKEWKTALGLNILINSTEELIPIGLFMNLQLLTLRVFEYKELKVDKLLITPSIGLYKNIGNARVLSSVNMNILQIGDTSEYSVFPSFLFQMSYSFKLGKNTL